LEVYPFYLEQTSESEVVEIWQKNF